MYVCVYDLTYLMTTQRAQHPRRMWPDAALFAALKLKFVCPKGGLGSSW